MGSWEEAPMTGRSILLVALTLLVATTVFAADVLEFRKVDVFVVDQSGNERKRDARLEIDSAAAEIRLVDEKRGASRATYAVIPIDDLTGLRYEAELGSRWGGVVGVRPARHWLTMTSDVLPSGQMRVRLDEDNQRELRYALRAATGIIDDLGPQVAR